mmetsp:Transcript_33334/g.99272  ORF Transcript_33334/g.99272 Transcript_33334/m.99272 type:complete len:97 (-) Transcript_33334:400-690(-)
MLDLIVFTQRSHASAHCCILEILVTEKNFTVFTKSPGRTLTPIKSQGSDFELHTLMLNGRMRFWMLVNDVFQSHGSTWVRDASRIIHRMVTQCGTY